MAAETEFELSDGLNGVEVEIMPPGRFGPARVVSLSPAEVGPFGDAFMGGFLIEVGTARRLAGWILEHVSEGE